MPARKRKTTYPPAKTSNQPAPRPGAGPEPTTSRPSVVTINTAAIRGRDGLAVGTRVRLSGSGLYSGETATIERLVNGPIPAAFVRTDAGNTRQVRTIDLTPVVDEPPPARQAEAAPTDATQSAEAGPAQSA